MSAVSSELVFFLNGKKVVENGLVPDLSLIQYLRQGLRFRI
jgi:xanthine dehydrogenase iron-sulfur cluster and FAD-binding subunit A